MAKSPAADIFRNYASDEEDKAVVGIHHSNIGARSKGNKSSKNKKFGNTISKYKSQKELSQIDKEHRFTNGSERSSPSTHSINKEKGVRPSFTTEILAMMHAFGDTANPLYQSAAMIEEIVHRQISNLLIKTSELTSLRGAKIMTVEDILFQLRKSKKRLKHILKILNFKESKAKALKQNFFNEGDVNFDHITADANERDVTKLRKSLSEIFTHHEDINSAFESDCDEVQAERTERLEILTRKMDQSQYLEFSECRQVTFSKKINKFREWLDCISLVDAKPNTPAIELLSLLAYEIVGRIVELSLIIKADLKRRHSDYFSTYLNRVCIRSSHEFSRHFVSENNPHSLSITGPSGKRKRSQKDHDVCNFPGEPIQPHYIQEVIRRYDAVIGPTYPFTTYPVTVPLSHRTLCC